MTLEELSVVFSADVAPFAAAASRAEAMMSSLAARVSALADAFYQAGIQAGDGLKEGLLARRSAVEAAARTLAQAAVNALRSVLQIHSPSRVTFDAGIYFDEGLLRGIAGGASRVERQASALGRQTAAALSLPDLSLPFSDLSLSPHSAAGETASHLPTQLSLTVPLEVDGYRLGVAAIEGINLVNRGSGRVELTL